MEINDRAEDVFRNEGGSYNDADHDNEENYETEGEIKGFDDDGDEEEAYRRSQEDRRCSEAMVCCIMVTVAKPAVVNASNLVMEIQYKKSRNYVEVQSVEVSAQYGRVWRRDFKNEIKDQFCFCF